MPTNDAYYDDSSVAEYFESQEDFEDDKPFYVDFLNSLSGPQKVLEIGSGTGRLTRVLSQHGHTIIGVERSTAMIDVALKKLDAEKIETSKRPRYHHGNPLNDSPLSNDFDVVLIPEYTFGGFLSQSEQERILGYCLESLRSGGSLIIHLYLPNPAYFAALRLGGVGNPIREQVGTIKDANGDDVSITKSNSYSRVTGNVSAEVFYDRVTSEGLLHRGIQYVSSHAFTPSEISLLLEKCGFHVKSIFGSFDKAPLLEDSKELVVVSEKR
ncbi:methyltransferase domain-containing protein [Bacillus sp. BGMRC0062]|nr:methyltransferase domain-containing protein [Bacillus sp. BGMRC0062]